MKILPIENNSTPSKIKNITHRGITKRLSKKMFIDGKKDIAVLLKETKPKNTNVGELPPVMFAAITSISKNKQEISERITNVIKIFGEVAKEIRKFRPNLDSPREERINRRPNSAVEKLKIVFKELGLIDDETNFDLTYLGEGNYKKAFKIEGVKDPVTNEELCLKTFHLVDLTPEWHKYKTHGNFAELNTSAYWKKTQGMHTQRGKFYFGDISKGFFVDKYIDKNVQSPQKIVDETNLGIKLTDEVKGDAGHNKLYGYSIDPGGPRVVNRVKNESRFAQRIFNHIKNTPVKFRQQEWFRILQTKKRWNERQKEAGLAIAIKHVKNRSELFEECLKFHNQFADMGLAYVLKYLKLHNARKYFEVLMKRNDPITQTVLLNEIPLIAREKIKVDDLDVPKGEINTKRLQTYYQLAQKYVRPEIEQHLASYVHLLPDDMIIPEAEKLIAKNNYEIIDRLLHKIKFVKDEEFSFSKKMEILQIIAKTNLDNLKSNPETFPDGVPDKLVNFLKEKLQQVRTYVIRSQLED